MLEGVGVHICSFLIEGRVLIERGWDFYKKWFITQENWDASTLKKEVCIIVYPARFLTFHFSN